MKKVKNIIKSGLFIILGIIASCLLLEFILHFTDHTNYNRFQNDKLTGLLTYKPENKFNDSESCFDNQVQINNLGFHGLDVSPKQDGVFRIVVIGGSFVESLQVPVEKMMTTLLEEKLNLNSNTNYEVIPIGFSGNKTFLNVLYYLRFAKDLKPDLVINLITEYEPRGEEDFILNKNGEVVLSLPPAAQNEKTTALKNLMRNSKLLMNIYNRVTTITTNRKPYFGIPFLSKNSKTPEPKALDYAIPSQWEKESKILAIFANQVQKDKIPFLLLSWTTPEVSNKAKTDLPTNLNKISIENKFKYLNLEPGITAEYKQTGENPVWSCNDHWSPAGQLFAANTLYNYLIKNPSLISK